MISGERRLELDPLSINAIERLVLAWSSATGAPDWFAGKLYAEIAASSTLRQMAGNPFLLTAPPTAHISMPWSNSGEHNYYQLT